MSRINRSLLGAVVSCSVISATCLYIYLRRKGNRAPLSKHVFKCVLTGGPCGGKSSILRPLKESLITAGYRVFTVPEVNRTSVKRNCVNNNKLITCLQVSTLLLTNGAEFPGMRSGADALLVYEYILARLQISFEKTMEELSISNSSPAVIVCDRGIFDIAAYLPSDMWKKLLSLLNSSEDELLGRYDLVLHMVTAADGAEHSYGNASNSIRTENAQEAIALDLKCRECWASHKNFRLIDNSTDFESKIKRGITTIMDHIERRGFK